MRSERSQSSPFLLFLAGAAVGAIVALLTAKESGEEARHDIEGWLNRHGVDSSRMIQKVKNLLHVRKNGHAVNGHKLGGRRHGTA